MNETPRTDQPSLEKTKDAVRIIIPGYRVAYAANDFTNSKARSTDNAIASYLSTSAIRAPWGSPKKLILQITDDRNGKKEKTTATAYQQMFEWRAKSAIRKFLRQLPLVLMLVVIGAILLWASHRVDDFHWEEDLRQTAAEAVRLGAWVSLWSAASLFFSTAYECSRNYLAFRRLSQVPIEFDYKSSNTMPHRLSSTKRSRLS